MLSHMVERKIFDDDTSMAPVLNVNINIGIDVFGVSTKYTKAADEKDKGHHIDSVIGDILPVRPSP